MATRTANTLLGRLTELQSRANEFERWLKGATRAYAEWVGSLSPPTDASNGLKQAIEESAEVRNQLAKQLRVLASECAVPRAAAILYSSASKLECGDSVLEELSAAAIALGEQPPTKPRNPRKAARRRQQEPRALTEKQAEAVQLFGECQGNKAKAARQLGVDRKSFEDRYNAAMRKLGKAGIAIRPRTEPLPVDGRDQVAVVTTGMGRRDRRRRPKSSDLSDD